MLEKVDLNRSLTKTEYKRRLPALQRRLFDLHRACWNARLATVVVFEGWDAAGKGTAIRKLTERLEPRGFALHSVRAPRTHELSMPWLYRFWMLVPNHGEMAIFDRSWYGRVLVERVEELTLERQWREAYRDIVSFERNLADDRYRLAKFFLHISQEEQRSRLEKLESDASTAWEVEEKDWQHHEKYDEFRLATEEMLERTESEWGPWTIVQATDKRWARVLIFERVIATMEEHLNDHDVDLPEQEEIDPSLDPDASDDDSFDEDE